MRGLGRCREKRIQTRAEAPGRRVAFLGTWWADTGFPRSEGGLGDAGGEDGAGRVPARPALASSVGPAAAGEAWREEGFLSRPLLAGVRHSPGSLGFGFLSPSPGAQTGKH